MVSDNRDDSFKIAEDEKYFDKRINWIKIMGVSFYISTVEWCWIWWLDDVEGCAVEKRSITIFIV